MPIYFSKNVVKHFFMYTLPNQEQTAVGRRTCLVLHRLHLCFVFVYNNSLFLFCQVFKYDRFVDAKFYDQAGEEIRHPVMAFGSLCPGKRFAMAQMKLYLLTILTRFDLALDQGEHAEYDFRYHGHEVLPPVKDVNVNFRLKTDSPKLRLVEQRWFEQAWDTISKRWVLAFDRTGVQEIRDSRVLRYCNVQQNKDVCFVDDMSEQTVYRKCDSMGCVVICLFKECSFHRWVFQQRPNPTVYWGLFIGVLVKNNQCWNNKQHCRELNNNYWNWRQCDISNNEHSVCMTSPTHVMLFLRK